MFYSFRDKSYIWLTLVVIARALIEDSWIMGGATHKPCYELFVNPFVFTLNRILYATLRVPMVNFNEMLIFFTL